MKNISSCRVGVTENRLKNPPRKRDVLAVKIILQVFLGVILAACAIKAASYAYDRYSHRSTANQYEWTEARGFMDTLVQTCPGVGSSGQCTELAVNACRSFHINDSDCSELVHAAIEKNQK